MWYFFLLLFVRILCSLFFACAEAAPYVTLITPHKKSITAITGTARLPFGCTNTICSARVNYVCKIHWRTRLGKHVRNESKNSVLSATSLPAWTGLCRATQPLHSSNITEYSHWAHAKRPGGLINSRWKAFTLTRACCMIPWRFPWTSTCRVLGPRGIIGNDTVGGANIFPLHTLYSEHTLRDAFPELFFRLPLAYASSVMATKAV